MDLFLGVRGDFVNFFLLISYNFYYIISMIQGDFSMYRRCLGFFIMMDSLEYIYIILLYFLLFLIYYDVRCNSLNVII